MVSDSIEGIFETLKRTALISKSAGGIGVAISNIRASGSDEAIILTNALQYTLEQALEFIDDDELVEVTPRGIRLRKQLLKEHERKRA